METTYDPLTGSALPAYYTESSAPNGPFTGDSGYNYAQEVFDLLRLGVSELGTTKRSEIDSKTRYELGRAGLTPLGQPATGLKVGGLTMSPAAILLAVVGIAGVVYLASR